MTAVQNRIMLQMCSTISILQHAASPLLILGKLKDPYAPKNFLQGNFGVLKGLKGFLFFFVGKYFLFVAQVSLI